MMGREIAMEIQNGRGGSGGGGCLGSNGGGENEIQNSRTVHLVGVCHY